MLCSAYGAAEALHILDLQIAVMRPVRCLAPRQCKPWSQIAPTAHVGWCRLVKQDDELTLADQSTLDFGEDDLFELEAIAAEKQQGGSNVYLVKYRVGAQLCLQMCLATTMEQALHKE